MSQKTKTSPKVKKPSARTRKLVELGKRYYLPTYKPRETIMDRAKGARVWDLDGKDYIDLGSGIAVCGLGHHDSDLIKALTDQAKKIWHTSNIFYTEPPILLAEALVKSSGFAERAFFCNSGAEANEAAIKLARKYASNNGRAPDHREIITFHGSFHGRTLATVAATAQPKYHAGFEPLPQGFVYAKFNDEEEIKRLVTEKTCAILVEPIQGEGGVTPTKPGFLTLLRELCDKVGALLILDEVQCGMGRTGKLFAYMNEEGLKPDVVTLAKGLGGGFPVGAMLVGPKAEQTLQFGSHGTTFGGNPMATAVAGAVLKKLKSAALMRNVSARSKQLRDALQALNKEFDLFREIRGQGLMIGAELADAYKGKAGDISEVARLHGLLILQAGPDVMRMVPPLTITQAEVHLAMKRFREALIQFLKQ